MFARNNRALFLLYTYSALSLVFFSRRSMRVNARENCTDCKLRACSLHWLHTRHSPLMGKWSIYKVRSCRAVISMHCPHTYTLTHLTKKPRNKKSELVYTLPSYLVMSIDRRATRQQRFRPRYYFGLRSRCQAWSTITCTAYRYILNTSALNWRYHFIWACAVRATTFRIRLFHRRARA